MKRNLLMMTGEKENRFCMVFNSQQIKSSWRLLKKKKHLKEWTNFRRGEKHKDGATRQQFVKKKGKKKKTVKNRFQLIHLSHYKKVWGVSWPCDGVTRGAQKKNSFIISYYETYIYIYIYNESCK